MPFGSLSLNSTLSEWPGQQEALEESLLELRSDLAQFLNPQIALIARGPLVSWVAQLHLESNPLAGLILIDPLPLDEPENTDVVQAINFLAKSHSSARTTQQLQTLHNNRDTDIRPLLLEPGSVPMMLFHSFLDQNYINAVHRTAERHRMSDDDDELHTLQAGEEGNTTESNIEIHPGEIPILSLSESLAQSTSIGETFQTTMLPWIKIRAL
jgi:hypothetical protein